MPLNYYTPREGDQNASVPISVTSLVCAVFPVIVLVLGARTVACFAMISPFAGLVLGLIGYLRAPRDTEWIGVVGMMANGAVIVIAVLALPSLC